MLIRRQRQSMMNASRLLSTQNTQVRQAGISKPGLIAVVVIGAGALLYQQRSKEDNSKYIFQWNHWFKYWIVSLLSEFYNGDSDPYEKAKQLGDKIDKSVKKDAHGVADELGSAGQHVKNAVNYAGQAAQDAFSEAQREGRAAVNDIKRETRDLRAEADKFASEHHLKEGDRSPEDVLSHAYNSATSKASNVAENLKSDANEAAFSAAGKFKEAKESVSNELNKTVYDQASIAHGNPMVYEKHSTEKTKPGWENRLEEFAQTKVHDTSTLVSKDTEKVRAVWEDKSSRDLGHGSLPVAEETSSSYWSSLFGQAKEVEQKVEQHLEKDVEKAANIWEDLKNKAETTANDVKEEASNAYQNAKGKATSGIDHAESSWNNVKSHVKDDANAVYDKASDAASDVSSKFKKETDKAVSNLNQAQRDAQNKGSQLKRDISERLQAEKDHASSNLNDLHKEVSANADKWKDQTEQTAKSWYQKGTDQVKSGLNSVKNAADRDIQWTEEKVQDGLSTAKEEVDRLFGAEKPKEKGYTGHVLRGEKYAEEEEGQLRNTRASTDLKPAKVVVENATGKEM